MAFISPKEAAEACFQPFSTGSQDRLMLEKSVKGQLQRDLNLYSLASQAKL